MSVHLVALGDSTAVGVGALRGGGYPEHLASRLRKEGLSVGLTNLGVSGARTADVVQGQLRRAVAAQPTLVTLGIGVNDLWRGTTLDAFSEDLERIARRMKQTGAPVVVSNLPDLALAPVAKLVPSSLYEGRIEPFNDALAEVARRHGLHLVDLYGASRAYIPRHPEFFSGDGFHPSEAGYAQWAEFLYPTVRGLIR
jgi:acyl-CoA thioesterase I